MSDKIRDAILSRFRAGDPIADIADDLGIPQLEVEHHIRSTGCVEVPDWLIYRGIQMAVVHSYPLLQDWLLSHFHGLSKSLQSTVLFMLSIESAGPEANTHYSEISELYTDLKDGSL
jgi:hypothetical protein